MKKTEKLQRVYNLGSINNVKNDEDEFIVIRVTRGTGYVIGNSANGKEKKPKETQISIKNPQNLTFS